MIGLAIPRQIRDAKQEITDALYPLTSQIIGKAFGEAIRELARNIDAHMQSQMNFKQRLQRLLPRLRGLSAGEAALPYQIHRVLLIQRQSGLLLLGALAFACMFTLRLWSLAFPK